MDYETKSFTDFLKYFSRRKNNLLRQSNATPIKRFFIETVDMSAQPTSNTNNSTNLLGNSLYKIPTKFYRSSCSIDLFYRGWYFIHKIGANLFSCR